MVFQTKRAAQGGLSWAFFIAIILLNNYSPALSPTWRSISISMVPALLIGLQQNPYFINPKASVLMISSLVTFIYMSLIQLNGGIKRSMEDPNKNRLTSGLSYASVSVVFGLAFMMASWGSSGGYKDT